MSNSSHHDQLNRLNRAISKSGGIFFSLITVICNYKKLREITISNLDDLCPVEIKKLRLSPDTTNLFKAIETQLKKWGEEQPSAVMILGLEKVQDLETLLANAKGERDRFGDHFSFPLILWMTDEVRKKLANVATDFHNWTGIPISFHLTDEQLIELIEEETNIQFNSIIHQETDIFFAHKKGTHKLRYCRELELAKRELSERGIDLEPELEANLFFIIGRDYHIANHIKEAITNYKKSLQIWRKKTSLLELERQGILLYCLSLCYRRQAELKRARDKYYWTWERAYIQKCLTVFDQAKRKNLKAKFISKLGEVLLRLEKWDALQAIALKSEQLHKNTNSHLQLAQDYGFQAKVALKKGEEIQQRGDAQQLVEQAINLTNQALQICEQVDDDQQHSLKGWYFLLLAEAQQQLNQTASAIDNLEKAKTTSHPHDNPQLYIEILNKLCRLYSEQKQYLKAFQIKQERQIVESQFGFRAFIGAASLKPQTPKILEERETVAAAIAVSGREKYIDKLLSRFYDYGTKLSVIHGPSGVGKSSTIKAGLIPILKQKIIQDSDVLPLSLSLSDNWVREIGQILTHTHLKSLSNHPERFCELGNSPKILEDDLKELIRHIELIKIEIKTLQNHLQQFVKSLEDEVAKQELTTYYQRLVNSHPLTQEHLGCLKEQRELLISNLELQETKEGKAYSEDLDSLIKKEEKINTLQNRLKNHSDLLDSKAAAELRTCLERIDEPLDSIEEIKAQLRNNKNWKWLTVLIFDQFEEFFFNFPQGEEQQRFWDFLNDCLETDLVYVVLSLREDYLHYLLKWEPFIKSGRNWEDILSSKNRLPLKDFDKDASRNIIKTLTEQSQFYLEEELIDQLVNDLANNSGYIRPIELQIVGYQLQEKGISTLREYENLRNEKDERINDSNLVDKESSKSILVLEYLKEVVESCGSENKQEADLILYLLTDENYKRPLKTRREIATELESLKEVEEEKKEVVEEKLNLVLKIFVKSGLVLLWTQIPDDRYQLVHDYLVNLIRSKQRPTEYQELVEKLSEERKKSNQALREKAIAEVRNDEIAKQEKKTKRLNEQLTREIKQREEIEGTLTELRGKIRKNKKALSVSSVFIAGLIAIAGIISINAVKTQTKLNINKLELGSQEVLDELNSGILEESFLKAMVWGHNLNKMGMVDKETKGENHYPAVTPIFSLQQTLDAIQTQENRYVYRQENQALSFITVSFDSTGQVAAISHEGDIITWNPETSEKPKKIDADLFKKEKQLQANVVKFSLDGQKILITFSDGTVIVSDRQGNELTQFKAHDHQITDASFSPNGESLATNSDDGITRIWDLQSNPEAPKAECKDPQATDKTILGVSFSSTGEELATVSVDGFVRLWDRQCKLIKKVSASVDDKLTASYKAIQSVSFSPDGKRLAVGLDNGTVIIWKLEDIDIQDTSKKIKHTKILAHEGSVLNIKFSHDGKQLATNTNNTNDTTVRLWDMQGNPLSQFFGHENSIWDIDFNADGTLLATASADGTVRLWTLGFNNDQIGIESELGSILDAHLSNNEQKQLKILVVASDKKTAYIKAYRLDNSGKYRLDEENSLNIKLQNNEITEEIRGRFSPNGELVATTSRDKVYLWNLQGKGINKEPIELEDHQGLVYDISFSDDGKLIATASKNGIVSLWNLQGKKIATCGGHEGEVLKVSFSSDGKRLASASADRTALVWEWDSQNQSCQKKKSVSQNDQQQEEKEVVFRHRGALFGVSFNNDGNLLATVSQDKTAKLWDLRDGKEKEVEFKGHKDWVRDVRFSQDEKLVITASRDKTINVWNLKGKLMAQHVGHSSSIKQIKFRPGSSQLVSISNDNTVRFWQIEEHDNFLKNLLEQGCTELEEKTYFENLFKQSEDYQTVMTDCRKLMSK